MEEIIEAIEFQLTPLEARASAFVSNLMFHASIEDLIERDAEVQAGLKAFAAGCPDPEERDLLKQVNDDNRIINATFMVAGMMLENAKGISA